MALPKPVAVIQRFVVLIGRRIVSLKNRLLHGYGRHDADLARFTVPVHRTDAELRGLLQGGAR